MSISYLSLQVNIYISQAVLQIQSGLRMSKYLNIVWSELEICWDEASVEFLLNLVITIRQREDIDSCNFPPQGERDFGEVNSTQLIWIVVIIIIFTITIRNNQIEMTKKFMKDIVTIIMQQLTKVFIFIFVKIFNKSVKIIRSAAAARTTFWMQV